MQAKIHRGANEVGGSCIELEAGYKRLVLDLGRPISADRNEVVPLPAIVGLEYPDPSLVGDHRGATVPARNRPHTASSNADARDEFFRDSR